MTIQTISLRDYLKSHINVPSKVLSKKNDNLHVELKVAEY